MSLHGPQHLQILRSVDVGASNDGSPESRRQLSCNARQAGIGDEAGVESSQVSNANMLAWRWLKVG